MSNLKVYHEDQPAQVLVNTSDGGEMARHLKEIGVRFERWQTAQPVAAGAAQDVVLTAYRQPVGRLMQECGYQTADVISLTKDNPDKAALRQKFLNEHIHDEDEVRFFVDGRGLFYLHAAGKVYGVLCEKGDLISVPAGTTHWFDMGAEPHLACIRLFTDPAGWVAKFTGSPIAQSFPMIDEPVAAVA
jgi:1,2-dihydroxy-3-keto-5-methylthiopentene dioxygenase